MSQITRPKRSEAVTLKPDSGQTRVTVKMDETLKKQIRMKILEDDYNMRQKSLWVTEAVEKLLEKEIENIEGVVLSEIMITSESSKTQDVFTFPTPVYTHLNKIVRKLNVNHPALNANQSSLIRAAINRRLLDLYMF